jgi:2-oxoglutarate ferredoxin oxidoreductase subunit gamma
VKRKEFRLSGSGGQGLILAAIILADAAAQEGNYVVQTQSYGPEARGGASKAEVIIDEAEIDYPKVTDPDFVLTMSVKAYEKYGTAFKDEGMLLVDSTFVKDIAPSAKQVVALPITKLARDEIGKEIVSNIVALGVINGLTKAIGDETLKEAILHRTPAGTEDLNIRAFELGLKVAREYLEKGSGGK